MTLIEYLLALDTLLPDLTRTQAMAALVLPTWLLYGIALTIVARRAPQPTASGRDRLGLSPAWSHAWTAPLLHGGLATLAISTLGSASDAPTGLLVSVAYAALLALVGTRWRAPAELGLGLVLGGAAFQQGLRMLGVPAVDQPPLWALVGLVAALLALAIRRSPSATLRTWYAPLAAGSAVVGAGALAVAMGLRLALASRATLQPLAITAAVTGLTLLAHAFGRRDRVLAYLGVALLGLGAILRWRRTFFGSGLALVADVLILLSDPLRAVNTWYLVAIIGLAMIGVVVFVEQRRQQIPFWLDEWRQRLERWD